MSGSSIMGCPERKFFVQNLSLFSLNQPKSLLQIYHSQPGWQRKQHTFLSLSVTKKVTLPGLLCHFLIFLLNFLYLSLCLAPLPHILCDFSVLMSYTGGMTISSHTFQFLFPILAPQNTFLLCSVDSPTQLSVKIGTYIYSFS